MINYEFDFKGTRITLSENFCIIPYFDNFYRDNSIDIWDQCTLKISKEGLSEIEEFLYDDYNWSKDEVEWFISKIIEPYFSCSEFISGFEEIIYFDWQLNHNKFKEYLYSYQNQLKKMGYKCRIVETIV